MSSYWNQIVKIIFAGGFFSAVAVAETKPVLNDWFALGSGCRAKSDLPGNVKMESLPVIDVLGEQKHRVKFSFTDFALKGETFQKGQKKFGRECAVRLNINPPAGKKLIALRAVTKVAALKDSGPALDLLSELKLGAVSLGSVQSKMDNSAKVSEKDESIDLRAGVGANEPLPQLGCGEPKIIGFDYSWIATRDRDQKGRIHVELSKEKSLIIEATLADCQAQ